MTKQMDLEQLEIIRKNEVEESNFLIQFRPKCYVENNCSNNLYQCELCNYVICYLHKQIFNYKDQKHLLCNICISQQKYRTYWK